MAITVERLEAKVDADSSAAIASLGALEVALDTAARDRKATINVDVDNGAAQLQSALSSLTQVASGLGSALSNGLSGVSSALSGITSAAGSAEGALSGLGGAAGGAGSSLGSMGGASSNLVMSLVTAIPQMAMMAMMMAGIYSAATVAAGALQMLAAAAAGVYAALFPLIGLLGAIPVGLGAIGGGIGAVVLGFGGITKAMGAMDQAQGSSGRATKTATNNALELKSARQGIVDANKSVTRAEQDLQRATEGVAQAQKDAARDLVEQRRSMRDAIWAEEDAIDRLQRAQENLTQTQENLNKAQKKVGQSGAILSKETDDFTGKVYDVARISASASVDAVDAAEQEAQAAKDLARAKRDAEREVVKAQEGVERATERRRRQAEDLAIAEKKGIKGSDKYKDAVRRQEDAQQALARAHDNVKAAMDRLARVQAQQAKGAAGAAGGVNALNKAMNALTPAGRKFVKFLHDEFMPAFKTIKDAAQEGLLPGVEKGLRSLMTVFPQIKSEMFLFAKGMGDGFAEVMAHFTSPTVVKELMGLSKLFREVLFGDITTGMKGLKDAIIPLGDIFIAVTKAAGPMTKMIVDDLVGGLDKISAWMKKPANAKRLEGFFTEAWEMAKLWGKVLKPIGSILVSLSDAAKPLAKWMLTGIADSLTRISTWFDQPENKKKVSQWFEDMKPAIRETAGLLGDILKMFFKPKDQGKEDSPFTKTIKALRTEFIPAVERLMTTLGTDNKSGPSFVTLLTSLTDAITALVSNPQAITDFIDTVRRFVDSFTELVDNMQKVVDSPVWSAIATLIKVTTPTAIAAGWTRMREENDSGINEWETYTRPKWEKTLEAWTSALKLIPIVGPMIAAVHKFIGERWLDIISIFTSGDIAGSLYIKFASLAQKVMRLFADALNPVIRMYNKIAGLLPGLSTMSEMTVPNLMPFNPAAQFTKDNGSGSGAGSGSGSGGSYSTKTTSTVKDRNAGLRAFGGPVAGGQSYIVGEKRAELLTMPPGTNGRIAAAVPRPMNSTASGMSDAQLERILERVLAKAKPNVDMKVDMHEHADPKRISHDLAWSLR